MKPVIETHALCKSYHGRPVVDHLNPKKNHFHS